jgi:phosphoribosylformimino-5-aminoimidazole carboxamide ribotide isomerase
MLVIPAIDLKGGRCVRLVQGDMQRETVYAEDPVAVARGFEDAGAEWIHVVDLDGAISGKPVNEDAIARVCAGVRAKVEVGGGIRDLATPDFFATACRRHPGRILAGIDARKGKVSVAGWTKDSSTDAAGLAVEVQRAGAAAIVFTDIARDGTGDGVNAAATDALADAVDVPVIASGGVASLADVRKLRDLQRRNLEAVIVGRAIYVGALDLATALRVGRGEEP